ncbi:MAG: hypothetical protein ACTTKL_00660 [Treponema sp.]
MREKRLTAKALLSSRETMFAIEKYMLSRKKCLPLQNSALCSETMFTALKQFFLREKRPSSPADGTLLSSRGTMFTLAKTIFITRKTPPPCRRNGIFHAANCARRLKIVSTVLENLLAPEHCFSREKLCPSRQNSLTPAKNNPVPKTLFTSRKNALPPQHSFLREKLYSPH